MKGRTLHFVRSPSQLSQIQHGDLRSFSWTTALGARDLLERRSHIVDDAGAENQWQLKGSSNATRASREAYGIIALLGLSEDTDQSATCKEA